MAVKESWLMNNALLFFAEEHAELALNWHGNLDILGYHLLCHTKGVK